MSRETAQAWFTAMCRAPAPIREFLEHLDAASDRGLNCWFHFGPNTTQSGQPHLVYHYEGEFFAFALTAEQAAALDLSPGQVVWGLGGMRLSPGQPTRAAAILNEPQIQVANTKLVSGRVGYEMPFNQMLPSCLRMTWDRPEAGSVTMFHHLDSALMPVGEINFRFDLPAPGGVTVRPQPVVLFFSLQSVPDGKNPTLGRALSDIRAVLANLAAPQDLSQ